MDFHRQYIEKWDSPSIGDFESLLLRRSDWAAALNEKRLKLERHGIDSMISVAPWAKMSPVPRSYWIIPPSDRFMTLDGEVYLALELIKEWWDRNPLATGNIAVIAESPTAHTDAPFVPCPFNFVFPEVRDFRNSLRREGLATELVDAAGYPLHLLFGVIAPDGEDEEDEDDEPKHIPEPDFGDDVERIVNDPRRMAAMTHYLAEFANRSAVL